MKNRVEVFIEGKAVILTGEESEEYIKLVAEYVDKKYKEVKGISNGNISSSMLSVLAAINITDEYFKEKERNLILQEENDKSRDDNSENFSKLSNAYEELTKLRNENEILKTENERLIRINNNFQKLIQELRQEETPNNEEQTKNEETPNNMEGI